MGLIGNGKRGHDRPSPHGEGGLKLSTVPDLDQDGNSPSPHGEGGLKYAVLFCAHFVRVSLPPRGGWIEIPKQRAVPSGTGSLPPRGGWIEIWGSCCTSETK